VPHHFFLVFFDGGGGGGMDCEVVLDLLSKLLVFARATPEKI
jgi:hypothetical protein